MLWTVDFGIQLDSVPGASHLVAMRARAGVPTLTGPGCAPTGRRWATRPRLAALDTAASTLLAAGAELSEPTRARVPAGIDAAGTAARYALRDGFYLTRRFRLPTRATTPAFPRWCARRLNAFAPVHRWHAAALADTGSA